MASCLGMYIEPNIIKYAKVSKDHDILTVESFGIKFYDKLGDAIKQIIEDTYSFKVPISINLSEEVYDYFYMFSLLTKNDMKKAIATEFESYCAEKQINRNALETRYALVNSLDDKDRVKVIHISVNKATLDTMSHDFGDHTVTSITPLGISISNLANLNPKENVAIINMEKETTLTTIVDQKIYSVDKIPEGSGTVLDSINLKENSYSKAYEICKNTTIYTMEGKELQDEANEYLEDIMPTVYQIANKAKEIINTNNVKIDKIYITGTLTVINNIDLYFQEFFSTEKCEILKPFFIKDTVKISMQDYIEVNSALALALQGLEYGLRDINFKKVTWKNQLSAISFGKGDNSKQESKFSFELGGELDNADIWLLRTAGGILFLTIIYICFSMFLNSGISKKNSEVADVKADTQLQMLAITEDISNVNAKANQYIQLKDNLENIRKEVQEKNKTKKTIPNLLSQIMFSIPQGVQITSIENTTNNHIVIKAQARQHEQLGYFKAILRTQGILKSDTVVSTNGVKENDLVKIVIEGELP